MIDKERFALFYLLFLYALQFSFSYSYNFLANLIFTHLISIKLKMFCVRSAFSLLSIIDATNLHLHNCVPKTVN